MKNIVDILAQKRSDSKAFDTKRRMLQKWKLFLNTIKTAKIYKEEEI